MFFLYYQAGIGQPRVLGGFSLLDSAVNYAEDHAEGWKPKFKKGKDEWLAKGKDKQYWIRADESQLPAFVR